MLLERYTGISVSTYLDDLKYLKPARNAIIIKPIAIYMMLVYIHTTADNKKAPKAGRAKSANSTNRYTIYMPKIIIKGDEPTARYLNCPNTNEIIRPMSEKQKHIKIIFLRKSVDIQSLLTLKAMSQIQKYDRLR